MRFLGARRVEESRTSTSFALELKKSQYIRHVDFCCLNVTRITWNEDLDGSSRKRRREEEDEETAADEKKRMEGERGVGKGSRVKLKHKGKGGGCGRGGGREEGKNVW